jgi:3-(3-hydroxy-phenyl)propionate hydroxylase
MILEPGNPHSVEVLIVGAGPTGMTLANLLGHAGVDVMLIELHAGTGNEPRAVSFDDESLRTLQACGLADAAYGLILQGTGTKYYGMNGQPLAYARGPRHPPLGHPVKNPFSQPKLEQMLLAGLARFASVRVSHRTELIGYELEDGGGALASVRRPDGSGDAIRARFVVGCDGGRSTLRGILGIAMHGSSFAEPWLVIDTLGDDHDERYAMHHCDPRRPCVVVPGRDGRCRYEFMLLPGENPDNLCELSRVQALLAPFREISAGQLERCSVYTFHALIAERWRQGPAFLAGDAAHMMPPFAGQGLNSGFRDAANLAWKLAAVVRGDASERLLDTYETERRPHAEAITRFSVRLGRVMMTRNVRLARVRDWSIRFSSRVPAVHRYIAENRFKPVARYDSTGAILVGDTRQDVVGRMFPQPLVLRSDGSRVLLDEVLGPGYALVAVAPPPHGLRSIARPVCELFASRVVELVLDDRAPRSSASGVETVADIDGGLTARLAPYRGSFLLIRPDRFVAAVLPLDLAATAEDLRRAVCLLLPVDSAAGTDSRAAAAAVRLLASPKAKVSR